MRQAGRYLPEYRELRTKAATFIEFCYTPALAIEATLQPIRRFGFDAAILFSDILVVPDALGQPVSFESGHGPRLQPIETQADFTALKPQIDLARLGPVFETIAGVKAALPAETALIGFCGAPFTVASYMVAGKGTPDQGPARLMAYRQPALFETLIDRLIDASATYLAAQVAAGVEAVQIFDSWAGVLPPLEYERWSLAPIERLIGKIRAIHPDLPIIAFPRVAGGQLIRAARGLDAAGTPTAIGLDTVVEPEWAQAALPPELAVQGNLDPLALVAGGAALDAAIERILEAFEGRPHIFNLGHGIVPETPIAHVEQMMRRLRGHRA
jgi:uroporphyrinogen decarboxylase